MIYGVMLKSVKLTGTSLELEAGQIVELHPATNIPAGDGRYYAQPAQDEHGWGSGSILLDPGDVEIYS